MSSKKQLYSLEFPVRCSVNILYEFLSTPSGLQEWFCDGVNIKDNYYEFIWNGVVEKAKVIDKVENKFIRFQWDYMEKGEYFEFAIQKSDITNQILLVIKDFAEKKDIKDQTQLWDYQVKDLLHRLGN